MHQDDLRAFGPEPLVTLEDHVEGNWDEQPFAPNAMGLGRPDLPECFRVLAMIRLKQHVQDFLVAIDDVRMPKTTMILRSGRRAQRFM